ncbi:glycosyltransferase [Thalassotalea sp. PLHSN55]|uniref:glycosyltransferase n=1 Tax=Thalassotalea sp. PLHSN55 TaxID=3435888 RepID=UPI003F87FEDE
MTNIIHVVSSLNVGGAEKFVKNLSIEQDKQQDNVKVVSFGRVDDPFQAVLTNHPITIVNLIGGMVSRLKQFLSLIKNVDIIHIHSPSVIRAFLPIFPFLLNKKVIYTIHGEVDPPQGQLRLAHQFARLYLNKIVAVSLPAKLSVKQRYGWQSTKVDVIKNGVSTDNPHTETTQDGILRLGVVSRLIPLKNIALLLSVLKSMPAEIQAKIKLQIFGDGPEKAPLTQQVTDDKLENLVTFHGNVIDENQIYPKFDVLVMCSNTEGLPMSILEAMGFGLPVISTDVGAISQVVDDKSSGWLYQVKDGEALNTILTALIQNPEKISTAGKQAKQFIDDNYAIASVYQDYQKVYSS